MSIVKRSTVFLAALVAVLALTAGAASAAPVTDTDPAGDGHGPGDIRALRLAQTMSNDVTFRLRLAQPLNIFAAAAWHRKASKTFIQVNIDNFSGNPGRDSFIMMRPGPGNGFDVQLIGLVARPRGLCPITVTQPQATMIQFAIPALCVSGSEFSVKANARYRFDQGGDGTSNSDDRVPTSGFGHALAIET